jgi:hypothetical protein
MTAPTWAEVAAGAMVKEAARLRASVPVEVRLSDSRPHQVWLAESLENVARELGRWKAGPPAPGPVRKEDDDASAA